MTDILFPQAMTGAPRIDASVKDEPRVLRPNRTQPELRPVDLEGLLPPGHRTRIVWEFVEGLDLGPH